MGKFPVFCFFFALSFLLASAEEENILTLNAEPPLVNGLSWTCAKLESIVKKRTKFSMKEDISQTVLQRLHFHDCFVQDSDTSVLFDGSASGPSEPKLQAKASEIINDIKEGVDKACRFVSCSDSTDWASRDSVSEGSVAVVDRVFKGRRNLQSQKLKPNKPNPDRGHSPQHDCIHC